MRSASSLSVNSGCCFKCRIAETRVRAETDNCSSRCSSSSRDSEMTNRRLRGIDGRICWEFGRIDLVGEIDGLDGDKVNTVVTQAKIFLSAGVDLRSQTEVSRIPRRGNTWPKR